MATPILQPRYVPTAVPMGFAAQIKALQDGHREQGERLNVLEVENAKLRVSSDNNIKTLLTRIEQLEQHNAHLTARRKEAVEQLMNMRTLHLEASNALHVRAYDIQPDDLEGMLCVHGTAVITVLNHHQCALTQHRTNSVGSVGNSSTPQSQQPVAPMSIYYAYPLAYTRAGYCLAHNIPYCCPMCGR